MPDLFANQKNCVHCQLPPLPGSNKILFNGFRDADTGELVCWNCREMHYKNKQKSDFPNLYSE